MMHANKMLKGRQLGYLIFRQFKRDNVEVGMTEFRDLQNIRLKGDNLSAFVNEWDACIYGMQNEASLKIQKRIVYRPSSFMQALRAGLRIVCNAVHT